MKSLVLVKYVPDANSVFRINREGTWVDESSLTFTVNDYDRYALEALLALKDAGRVEEVVALTVGAAEAASALRTCLATGADRAIHVKDDALRGADPLSLGRVIHAAIAKEEFGLVLAGLQADDDNHTQVGGIVAGLLDYAYASAAMQIEMAYDSTLRVERELGNNQRQVVELDLPAVVTVQTGINTPRYASLKGIMAAKKKPLTTVGLADLGLSAEEVGGAASRLTTVALEAPPKGQGAELLDGSAEEVARQLVARIREKTGVL